MRPFAWGITFLLIASCSTRSSDVRFESPDFGVVSPGSTTHLVLRLQNTGSTATKLVRIERRSGAEGFTITPGKVQLNPGEQAEWNVSFSSTVLGLSEARFAAVFDSGTAEFSLRARVADRCVFAQTFDVGDARVGSSTSRTITVTNPLDEPGEVYVGQPEAPFSAQPGGTLKLAPHESKEVTITLAPRFAGEPRVNWLLRPSADCTLTEVTLTGRAVDSPLSVTPGRLDFGTLAAGSTRMREVTVQNHTRDPLRLVSSSSSNSAFVVSSQLPLVVAAEGSVTLTVQALAASAAPFDGVLKFVTSSADQPELPLPALANRASTQCLIASTSPLDFGSSEVGCRSHDALIVVTNDCPHEVRLGDRTVSSGFALIASPAQSLLHPGDRLEFALNHSATAVGETNGAFDLSVDVLDGQQVLSVPLQALGTPAREVEESELIPPFTQPLDVLFVIDDSPGILPLSASIERNLGDFARWGNANGYDFRVGVMSSDTTGRLRSTSSGAKWLANPTPAELQALGAPRGLAASRSSCIETLTTAFSDPLRHDASELGGLLRADAGLYVICVTNSRDAVQTAPLVTITSLLSLLKKPYELAVIANFLEVPGCAAQLEHGPLAALAAQANGVMEEICTPNWEPALERIGRNYFGWRTNFYLHQRPALTRGPLRVFVDEEEIPEVDPDPRLQTSIWRYEGSVNAVLFEPLYVPEPGRTVRFRYVPDCAR